MKRREFNILTGGLAAAAILPGAGLLASSTTKDTSMDQISANKETALRYFELLANRDWDAIEAMFDDAYIIFMPAQPAPLPKDQHFGAVQMFQTAFPDIEHNITETLSEGDKVLIQMRITGTHLGELMGVPASGNSIDYGTMFVLQLKDGKFIEGWVEADLMGLMRQISPSE